VATVKEWILRLTIGALQPQKFYWMQNRTTPYDLSGKTATLRIKPAGVEEIEVVAPIVEITDADAGEITIAFTDDAVTGYLEDFRDAPIALQIDDRIIVEGKLKIRNWYE